MPVLDPPDLDCLAEAAAPLRPEDLIRSEVPEAATAIMLADGARGVELMLMLRAQHPDDPWSGHVSLPGGRRDPGDQDLLDTARRETTEEVGIALNRDACQGRLPAVQAVRRGVGMDLVVHPFVFILPDRPGPRPSAEVAEARWVTVRDLLDPENAGVVQARTPDGVRKLPGVRLGTWMLWGLTYRMLSDLFSGVGRVLAGGPAPRDRMQP